MRAGRAPPDDDNIAFPVPNPRLVNLPAADLLGRLFGASSSEDVSVPVLTELKRRFDEVEDWSCVANKVAHTMRDRMKVLEEKTSNDEEKIR
jgi:hypothetical protein